MSAVVIDAAETAFLIPYDYLYNTTFSELRPLYFVLISLWVCYLFYTMYSIADRHFTWALLQLSKLLRLSPDLAGMTLLAFGNGAPDFFTAVFGAKETPEMILGSSVGAGLFTITVVLGMVLLMAKSPGEKRTQVLEEGTERTLDRAAEAPRLLHCSTVQHSLRPVPFIRGTVMYLLALSIISIILWIQMVPFWIPVIMLVIYLLYLTSAVLLFLGFTPKKTSPSILSLVFDEQVLQTRADLFEAFQSWPLVERIQFSIKTTCWKPQWCETWWSFITRSILLGLKSPIDLTLNLTILPVEIPEENPEAEDVVSLRFLHRLRCVINPFFSLFMYIYLLGGLDLRTTNWHVWVIYGTVASLLSMGLLLGTRWQDRPWLFPLHVLYSFCTSILWIYACSNELLACLSSTGTILEISPTIMGIIVLAWGNSFGDLVADVAMASNGSVETAVTAAFSGPIQNVLLTIGTGFLIAALRSDEWKIVLSKVRPDMLLTMGLLLLVVVACLVVVPLRFDFKIPRNFGFVLIATYVVYLPCAILLGLDLIKLPLMS